MRHAAKAQQHTEGQQYRDGLMDVIKRIKPGMPRSAYLEVAKLFIKYGRGFTPNQRREMLGMVGQEKINLSPNVLIMRGYIKRDYKKADYMKANNRRIKAAWDYYFTHKRELYNKQMKSQHGDNWKNMSHKNFITVHTNDLEIQKKKERCLQLQGIVSQTKNAQIKANGLTEMEKLKCYEDKQFRKQLGKLGALKQIKSNSKKVQQMREQFQKYNKICARYGGYYGMKEVNGKRVPVCKEKGLNFPQMPVDVAEKQLQDEKNKASATKLQAFVRGRQLRNANDAAARQQKIQAWNKSSIMYKVDKCKAYMEAIMKGGQDGAAARQHYKTHKCTDVNKRYRQVLVNTQGQPQDNVKKILAESR